MIRSSITFALTGLFLLFIFQTPALSQEYGFPIQLGEAMDPSELNELGHLKVQKLYTEVDTYPRYEVYESESEENLLFALEGNLFTDKLSASVIRIHSQKAPEVYNISVGDSFESVKDKVIIDSEEAYYRDRNDQTTFIKVEDDYLPANTGKYFYVGGKSLNEKHKISFYLDLEGFSQEQIESGKVPLDQISEARIAMIALY